MKANKVTVSITTESLSIDSVRGLLMKVADEISGECEQGELIMDDGDSMKWSTERKLVEF